MTTPSKPSREGHAFHFRWVAAVFVGLLAVGFALGVVVYRRYVAYEPVAGRHVPSGAFGSARFDLTHVMLYEPFRRSIFPLVDALPDPAAAKGRRERLRARGVDVAAQVREVVVAFGPAPNDWAVVIGGTLARSDVAAKIADVVRAEGFAVTAADGGFSVGGSAPLFLGQADDGALVLASSAERLGAALPARDASPELQRASGGLTLVGSWVPPPLASLDAGFRAGSSLAVAVRAPLGPGADATAAEAALRRLLHLLSVSSQRAARAVAEAPIELGAGEVRADLALPREAVEELAAVVAEHIAGR